MASIRKELPLDARPEDVWAALREIAVSPLHYGAGYAVQVTGGHVLSPANASVLKIVADPGATQVAVDVHAAP